MEIAANKATQIMSTNNDPILIDTILPDGQCNLSANYGPIVCKSGRIGQLLRNGFCIFLQNNGPARRGDTAKQIDFVMFEGCGNEIWSLHDFAPVGTIIMNNDGTPLGVIRTIYGITCYIDNEI
jgi:hypothetical protein